MSKKWLFLCVKPRNIFLMAGSSEKLKKYRNAFLTSGLPSCWFLSAPKLNKNWVAEFVEGNGK